MNKRVQLATVAIIASSALIAGLALRLMDSAGPPNAFSHASAAGGLMAARLPDVNGQPQGLEQWRGKVLVVNFWATWCAPCREEIPAFMRVQDKWAGRGLQVVGIAIDDTDKVRPYVTELKVNYPILVGGLDSIDLARQAGNKLGGLPFTVILDRQGATIHSQLGGINQQKLEKLLDPLL